MKAFYKGFIYGVRCCTIICASITGAMGAIYGLVYLIDAHGEVVVAACSIVALIILFGIFEGLWARYQYNKLAKHLAKVEANKMSMALVGYEYEVNRTKKAMEAILSHDYSMIVR